MKKEKLFLVAISIILTMMLGIVDFSKAAPIKLSAVTFLPKFLGKVKVQLVMFDKINERSNGGLAIKYLGGPDIVKSSELGLAVKNGVIDIGILPGSMYSGLVPGGEMWQLSDLSPEDERKPGGFYDYWAKKHEKAGLHLIGRANLIEPPDNFFNILTSKKVEKLSDLAGLKISTTSNHRFFRELGAIPVNMDKTEIYSALQTGVVEGYWSSLDQILRPGLHKVLRYVVEPAVGGAGQLMIMNLDKWNSIPKHLQDIITETHSEMERVVWPKQFSDLIRKEIQGLRDAGVEFIKLSPAEAEQYENTFVEAQFQDSGEKWPEVAVDVRKLLNK